MKREVEHHDLRREGQVNARTYGLQAVILVGVTVEQFVPADHPMRRVRALTDQVLAESLAANSSRAGSSAAECIDRNISNQFVVRLFDGS